MSRPRYKLRSRTSSTQPAGGSKRSGTWAFFSRLLQDGANGGRDVVARGNGRELELAVVGHGHVARSQARDGRVEQVEPLLADQRRDLRAEPSALARLVADDEAARLGHRVENGILVERDQRPRIHDLHRDALLLE